MLSVKNIEERKESLVRNGVKIIGDIRHEKYGKLLTVENPDGHGL